MRTYEFALLRYVHDFSTGEFANIGVVLYDTSTRQLLHVVSDRYGRISEFFGELSGAAYKSLVRHLSRQLNDVDERLRQPDFVDAIPDTLVGILALVLPVDESCFQVSSVMYGVHEDPAQRVSELFQEYVGRFDRRQERPKREEYDIARDLDAALVRSGLTTKVSFDYSILSANYEYTFHAAWRNGSPQVVEPISFDLMEGRGIVEKASNWSGRLYNLSKGADFRFNALIAAPRDTKLAAAFDKAIAILKGAPHVRSVVREEESPTLIQQIRSDTEQAR